MPHLPLGCYYICFPEFPTGFELFSKFECIGGLIFENKISNEIKLLDPNIVPIAFFFSRSVSFPSDMNSDHKISLPGPVSLLPDLHFTVNSLSRKEVNMTETIPKRSKSPQFKI